MEAKWARAKAFRATEGQYYACTILTKSPAARKSQDKFTYDVQVADLSVRLLQWSCTVCLSSELLGSAAQCNFASDGGGDDIEHWIGSSTKPVG